MTAIDNNSLYAAFKAKDARFDGRFFVGISSTGIYCRPVCKARQPKRENCIFFPTAAEAEQAGYRPCLLCRPELAPGSSVTDARSNLVYRAARMLEENCGSGLCLEEIAGRLGCTSRHLRRVFTAEYQVTPVRYLQTCRLLLAKNLLTDTNLSVLDIALAAGFGSLRRFNELFKKDYKLSPTALRKRMPQEKQQNEHITLAVSYRPPYRWQTMLGFLAGRAVPGVEVVTDNEYMRTVSLQNSAGEYMAGWLRVGHLPHKNALAVAISESLLPVLPQVLAKVRHLFDLYCDPQTIYETLASMNDIRPGLSVLGTRLPGSFDAFEMSVRAVLGQQITVKAATTLAGRLTAAYGTPIETGLPGLTHIFPRPAQIAHLGADIENSLGPLGITASRARTIRALAIGLEQGDIIAGPCAAPEQEMQKLLAIAGIGQWTAQYIAMRTMEWPDAFLDTDVGVRKALSGYKATELRQIAEAWQPWRSYATINLWNYLSESKGD